MLVVGLIAVGLIVAFGFFGGEGQQAPSLSGTSFKIVTLNACWLFDGEGEEDFRYAPQCAEDAETHIADVANYLSTVDADFIAIQEIESADILHRVNEKLGGDYHEIFVQGTDEYTGQDVAGLSRYPVAAMGRSDATQTWPIPSDANRAVRGTEDAAKHFWATVELGDMQVTFIALHLLAYPTDIERFLRREAQALIIQELAKGFYDQGHEVVILGDVNDFDSTVCDAADNEPRSCVDLLFKDLDPEVEGEELVNAAASLPQEQRYTYWYDVNRNGIDDGPEEHSMLDHVYITQNLARNITDVTIDHQGYEARTVSDHWPVIVTLEFP